jgi:hypothetical protein
VSGKVNDVRFLRCLRCGCFVLVICKKEIEGQRELHVAIKGKELQTKKKRNQGRSNVREFVAEAKSALSL